MLDHTIAASVELVEERKSFTEYEELIDEIFEQPNEQQYNFTEKPEEEEKKVPNQKDPVDVKKFANSDPADVKNMTISNSLNQTQPKIYKQNSVLPMKEAKRSSFLHASLTRNKDIFSHASAIQGKSPQKIERTRSESTIKLSKNNKPISFL